MAKLTEQLASAGPPDSLARLMARGRRAGDFRTRAKRETHRARRRAERLDPEGAPTRDRYRGWVT